MAFLIVEYTSIFKTDEGKKNFRFTLYKVDMKIYKKLRKYTWKIKLGQTPENIICKENNMSRSGNAYFKPKLGFCLLASIMNNNEVSCKSEFCYKDENEMNLTRSNLIWKS